MKNKKIHLLVFITVIIIGGAIAYFRNSQEEEKTAGADLAFVSDAWDTKVINEVGLPVTTGEVGLPEGSPTSPAGTSPAGSPTSGTKTYLNSIYSFSFQYDQDLKVAEFKEGDAGDIVLVEHVSDTNDPRGFQIFVMPWDEGGEVITAERIHADIPELLIENPQEAFIGQNQKRVLIFLSSDPSFGKSREVWIIHEEYLYQITARAEADTWLASIMRTWKFQ